MRTMSRSLRYEKALREDPPLICHLCKRPVEHGDVVLQIQRLRVLYGARGEPLLDLLPIDLDDCAEHLYHEECMDYLTRQGGT